MVRVAVGDLVGVVVGTVGVGLVLLMVVIAVGVRLRVRLLRVLM